MTQEHIPPKGIFLKPRPKNTITVFSCGQCNQDTKLDDEYFRFWVTAGADPSSKLGLLWKNKVVGSSFKRSPALLKKIQDDHKHLLKYHRKVPLKTYAGNIVPDNLLDRCYMVDAGRINNVACKIVKGLYYHHFNKPLPSNVEFNVSDAPISIDELVEIIKKRNGMVGREEGEFIYWFRVNSSKDFISRWVLFFYLQNYLTVETRLNNV